MEEAGQRGRSALALNLCTTATKEKNNFEDFLVNSMRQKLYDDQPGRAILHH